MLRTLKGTCHALLTQEGVAFALTILLLFASPLLAHHSMGAYDSTKSGTITGTVTQVGWRNPHVNIHISVKNEDGKVSTRMVEVAGVGGLTQPGVDKSLFAIGATVTFEAWLPKDPSNVVSLAGRSIKLSDGRSLVVANNWFPLGKR